MQCNQTSSPCYVPAFSILESSTWSFQKIFPSERARHLILHKASFVLFLAIPPDYVLSQFPSPLSLCLLLLLPTPCPCPPFGQDGLLGVTGPFPPCYFLLLLIHRRRCNRRSCRRNPQAVLAGRALVRGGAGVPQRGRMQLRRQGGHDVDMTLDANYLRGTMAAVLSILKHTSFPENVAFHFLSSRYEPEIFASIRSTFPCLDFKVYRFDSGRVREKISKSIWRALDQPLNYAHIYLPHILPHDVTRIIYLDSDLVLINDVDKLWGAELDGKVVGAPEYCHANFTKYFTEAFWADPKLAGAFRGRNRRPCYFNTGVMVLDVEWWRAERVHEEGGGVDGGAKAKKNISLGFFAALLIGVGGGD